MHDFESRGGALRAMMRRAPGAVVLALAANVAGAQPAPAAQEARRVNINEYIVRGNTVLDARDIEKAVYPYLGPDRTLADIESAREALQTVYQERGYQSVYVDLPEQQQLLSEAFQTDVGVENPPINIGATGFLFYEVEDIIPARDRTLDEV
ncbi:MAG: ShlB/FhaC/HecB family hemolysin secretion/activation protein, partial [Achromobacter sp.]|nr:ShlB/FhaC/HecB family hemolysin secretion/activation protein [Achromobacter sp.]